MPTVLITGSNSGIGLEFAYQYAAAGWSVIATCRHPERAEDLQRAISNQPNIVAKRLDVTLAENIERLTDELSGTPIDVLINNAGTTPKLVWNTDPALRKKEYEAMEFGLLNPEIWRRVLDTNTIAPVMVTQALTKNILLGRERKIIMISSRLASISANFPDLFIYSTSKSALNLATRKIALSLRSENVIAISLHPGSVKTGMGLTGAELTAEESVASQRLVISNLTIQDSGQFFDYQGMSLPW